MDITEAIKVLTDHNEWRRGGDGSLGSMYEIGQAIDKAVEVMKFHSIFIESSKAREKSWNNTKPKQNEER